MANRKKIGVEIESVTTVSISSKPKNVLGRIPTGETTPQNGGLIQNQTSASPLNSSLESFLESDSEGSLDLSPVTPFNPKSSSKSKNVLDSKSSSATKSLYTKNQQPLADKFTRSSPGKRVELAEVNSDREKSGGRSPKREKYDAKVAKSTVSQPPSHRPSISLSALPRYDSSYKDDSKPHRQKENKTTLSGKNVNPTKSNSPSLSSKSSRIPVPLKSSTRSKTSHPRKDCTAKSKTSRPTTPTPSSSPSQRSNVNVKKTKSKIPSRGPSSSSKSHGSSSPDVNGRGREKPSSSKSSSGETLSKKGSNKKTKGVAKSGRPRKAKLSPTTRRKKIGFKVHIPKPFCPPQDHDYFHVGHDDCAIDDTIDELEVRAFLDSNPIFLNTFVDECVDRTTILNWIHFKSPPTENEKDVTQSHDANRALAKKKKKRARKHKTTTETVETETEAESPTEATTDADSTTPDETTAENDDTTETTAENDDTTETTAENDDTTETAENDGTTETTAGNDDTTETTAENDDTTETTCAEKTVHTKCKAQYPDYYSACVCNVSMPIFPPPCVPVPENPPSKRHDKRKSHAKKRKHAKSHATENAEDADDESTTQTGTTSGETSGTTDGTSPSTSMTTGEDETTTESKRAKSKKRTCTKERYMTSQSIMTAEEIESFKAFYGVDLRQGLSYSSSYAQCCDLEGTQMMTEVDIDNFNKYFNIDIRDCMMRSMTCLINK